ncbi:MAG TPA: diacylglycerol kinase family protein [Flavisolibacter sp.]|jgi:diacylglycerol kinase
MITKTIVAKAQERKPIKRFSWKERGASFRYAYHGIDTLFRTEHNAWIHSGFTIAALLLSLLLKINKTEGLVLILAISFVWTMEIINTAIEKMADFISTEKHPQIKLVKDLAAAAVLVSAVAALLIGTIIFLPKLLLYV